MQDHDGADGGRHEIEQTIAEWISDDAVAAELREQQRQERLQRRRVRRAIYEGAIREAYNTCTIPQMDARLEQIGKDFPEFGKPFIVGEISIRPNRGPGYYKAKRGALMMVFTDPRIGRLPAAGVRSAVLRDAARNAGYDEGLTDTVWYRDFGQEDQKVATACLMRENMLALDRHGQPTEQLTNLGAVYRRIIERRNPNPVAATKPRATGKTFNGGERFEWISADTCNYFGAQVKYREDSGTFRCMVKTEKGRENINILRKLAERGVSAATALRWRANAIEQAAAAAVSPTEQLRDDFERFTGDREL